MFNLSKWYQDLVSNPNRTHKAILIGEIGINHNGDLNTAKQLILMCKDNGCEFVKFQKRNPDICVPEFKKNEIKETPWGLITYLEYKKRTEFGVDEYLEIDQFCKENDIGWSASAWDLESQDFLSKFNLPFNKVASALNTNSIFLEKVASEQKLTFLSTGMASLEDIEKCVEIFATNNCPLILLHTVSTYPAQDSELNLGVIKTLKDRFNLPVGYSGHEASVSPSIVAATLGAVVIERHVTLDRTMWGTDQSASLESNGVKMLSEALNKIPIIIGSSNKVFHESEKKAAENLRYW